MEDEILPSPEAERAHRFEYDDTRGSMGPKEGGDVNDDWEDLLPVAGRPLIGSSAAGADLLTKLQGAQTALEDKEFKILEIQATHTRQLRDMRRQLESAEGKIRELQQANNDLLRQNLSVEDERAALEKRIELLQLRVHTASLDSIHTGSEAAQLKKRDAALAEAETKLSRLQSALQAKSEEASQLREELSARVSSLVSRDSEMEGFRAHVTQQEARIRALHDQLATFIQKDAHEAARAQIAEQDLEETRQQLSKRLGQLKKVVAALNALRQREASLSAALDAQTELGGQLQSRCSELAEEAARANESKAVLQQQYEGALEEVSRLSERVESLEQDARAKQAVVEAAIGAAEKIDMLTRALKAAGEERAQLLDSLSNAKADARRETLSLQRLADDRQAIIRGLQADLSAATAALSAASGASRAAATSTTFAGAFGAQAGSSSSSSGSAGSSSAETMMLGGVGGGGSSARRGAGGGVGSTGGKPIVLRTLQQANGGDASSSASSFVKGPPGAILSDTGLAVEAAVASEAECTRLRLQCESLARKIKQTEERLASAQRDQEQLLIVNERLRVSLENSGGGAAASAVASVALLGKALRPSSSSASHDDTASSHASRASHNNNNSDVQSELFQGLALCFSRYIQQTSRLAEPLRRLLASLHALRDSCRTALEGGGARGGGGAAPVPQLFGMEDLELANHYHHSTTGVAGGCLPMMELEAAITALLSPEGGSPASSPPMQEAVIRALITAASSTGLQLIAVPAASSLLQKEASANDELRVAVEERSAASIGDACATQ